MKKQLLFILFILLSAPVLAKTVFPPAYDVAKLKDSINVKLPSEYWQLYSTGDVEIKFKDILTKKYSDKFSHTGLYEDGKRKKGDYLKIAFNFAQYKKWVRFGLTNSTAIPKKVFIAFNSGQDRFYVYQGKKWHYYTTGMLVPWKQRNGDKNNQRILLTIHPGEQIVVYSNSVLSASIPKLYDYDRFVKESYQDELLFDEDTIITFGFAGFIAFALIFNLFFYYINREKLYLNYSIMLFFLAAMSALSAVISLWMQGITPYKIEVYTFVVGGFFISFINTIQLFLGIDKHFRNWSVFIRYFAWITSVLVFTTVIVLLDVKPEGEVAEGMLGLLGVFGAFAFIGFAVLSIVFVIIVIKTLIRLKKQKDPEAQIIFWALLPYFLTMLPVLSDYSLLTAMWGVAYLSWGMFARFKRLQQQYIDQALEKERITREKEEEKNALIAQQNVRLEQLVEERTAELEHSLENLKETQNQLIQSEKMASLGELTAGIAHEIQNPLNFVNNFGDVSVELIQEMEEELQKGDTDEAIAIAGDIKQNLEKIVHHGRRADSIVKGMLQHSRTSSGQKEPTDINALADEYLRLAYHGLRAKDKSFNAELITNFDANLPKVSVMPQDMGRVLLNLFTNAFYATQQKVKSPPTPKGGETVPYKPAVSVTTKRVGDTVEITVRDNGTGIPDAIKDKILQPFFTTKPTGEGTGLGLSLSYDVVVKAHGGTIEIDSVEGEYTAFVITLPL
ncbi:MAG: ATP-binding protein [Bacteroidia bacterium]